MRGTLLDTNTAIDYHSAARRAIRGWYITLCRMPRESNNRTLLTSTEQLGRLVDDGIVGGRTGEARTMRTPVEFARLWTGMEASTSVNSGAGAWFSQLWKTEGVPFANGLDDDTRPDESTIDSGRWMFGLFCLALCLRLLMAWRLGPVCRDGFYYFALADAIDHGQFELTLSYLSWNVYPLILLGCHKLGLSWLAAGKLWGALIGSAAVLPLFGWVRRMFDARIAVLTGLLYAVHPDLVEISVEPMREATFWCFFSLAMLMIWRSLTEKRWHQFILAGLCILLATYTRTEGIVLLIPVAVWGAYLWKMKQNRRLLAGALLSIGIVPLTVAALNYGLLKQTETWQWGRFGLVEASAHWITDGNPTTNAGIDSVPTASRLLDAARHAERAPGMTVGGFFLKMVKSLHPAIVLLLIGGLLQYRSIALRSDKLALLLMAGALLSAIGLQIRLRGGLDDRYYLSLLPVLLPFAALSLQTLLVRCERAAHGSVGAHRFSRAAWVIAAIIAVGGLDALSSTHRSRERRATLGRRIAADYGPIHKVASDRASSSMAYFVRDDSPLVELPGRSLWKMVPEERPDVVVCSRNRFRRWEKNPFTPFAERAGLVLAPEYEDEDFLVYVRADLDKDVRTARAAERTTTR